MECVRQEAESFSWTRLLLKNTLLTSGGVVECWTHTWGLHVLPDESAAHGSVRGLFVVYVCPVMSSATCPGCHLWDRLRGRCTTQGLDVDPYLPIGYCKARLLPAFMLASVAKPHFTPLITASARLCFSSLTFNVQLPHK